MDKTVLQWNCRGFRANFEELKTLLAQKEASVACLQEIKLKDSDRCSVNGFDRYIKCQTTTDGSATGGVGILVKKGTPHHVLSLTTSLQAVAVQVTLHRLLTVCSLYLPPGRSSGERSALEDLLRQLPAPVLMLGDFNAHSDLWGNPTDLPNDTVIEDFISLNDLFLFNDGTPTYLHLGHGSFTAIDLSLCSPSVGLDFTWEVGRDQHGSDHFPIFLSCNTLPEETSPRWVFKRADWTAYESLCDAEITDIILEDPDPLESFTSLLFNIALKTIPRSLSSKKHRKPWFTEECKKAIRLRRASLQKFNIHPTDDNLYSYRKAQANARRIIKKSKRDSWRQYVSKLNVRSSVNKVWDMVHKISGKYKGHQVHHLQQRNGEIATDKESIAEALAEEFDFNSSTSHYSTKFQHYKRSTERRTLCFNSNNTELYNLPFTILELTISLQSSHDTAVGPDSIHYQLLRHLPFNAKIVLLDIFNHIFLGEVFPPSWREAVVVAVPKAGKDISLPTNYRPIALTSCLCKTMERMVNGRLIHFLESNDLLSSSQSGFRSQRSTLDHLVSLETFIRDGMARGEHVLSIFFDLEKAYDTTWKFGIMSDLHGMGLRGHLPIFVRNFLCDRLFRVRMGPYLSSHHRQEMGVPQGCVLSVTLFSVKINSIVSAAGPGVHTCLYVDDFTISCRSRYLPAVERKSQLTLNRLQSWADKNGFRFSPSKTVCMHFCGRRGVFPEPYLTLNCQPIPVVEKTKFLGIMFDKKLNFKEHIKYLRQKCQTTLNLFKVLSKFDWGADREVLLRLFRSPLRARLDYGAIVYGSARPSYLERLKPVQNQALRLCLGAFRTSPISSIHVEAHELPISIRHQLLSTQFALRIYSNPVNPAHQCIFKYSNADRYISKPSAIRPLALRIEEDFKSICPDPSLIMAPSFYSDTPYWLLRPPELDFSMRKFEGKKHLAPSLLKNEFYTLLEYYPDHLSIYTDGSKDDNRVACAATGDHILIQIRLPDAASIYSAELLAIYEVLTLLECSAPNKQVLIVSDSLSSLQAIANFNIKNPYVFKIIEKCTVLYNKGFDLVLIWCPSHVGVMGNERADLLAKEALSFTTCTVRIPSTDLKARVGSFYKRKWQELWNTEPANKLHTILPSISKWPHGSRKDRREEVVLARARIGHTHHTHGYLLRREPQPVCIPCQCPLTVQHILLECVDFHFTRTKYFNNIASMRQLFEEVHPSKLLLFLKEIGLFYRF